MLHLLPRPQSRITLTINDTQTASTRMQSDQSYFVDRDDEILGGSDEFDFDDRELLDRQSSAAGARAPEPVSHSKGRKASNKRHHQHSVSPESRKRTHLVNVLSMDEGSGDHHEEPQIFSQSRAAEVEPPSNNSARLRAAATRHGIAVPVRGMDSYEADARSRAGLSVGERIGVVQTRSSGSLANGRRGRGAGTVGSGARGGAVATAGRGRGSRI